MLGRRLREHNAQCWLVNTGWSGGAVGIGKRMSLPYTRAMVDALVEGKLANVEYEIEPAFGLSIPKKRLFHDLGEVLMLTAKSNPPRCFQPLSTACW